MMGSMSVLRFCEFVLVKRDFENCTQFISKISIKKNHKFESLSLCNCFQKI